MSRIVQILEKLENQLDEKNIIKFSVDGEVYEKYCTFNAPADQENIKRFEKKHHALPDDLKEFLCLHNGARIFEDIVFGNKVGGGLHVFSLEEIESELSNDFFDQVDGAAIAALFEGCYLILNKGNSNLYLFEDGLEYRLLDIDFETFLQKYIDSEGDAFWE
ncbi:SMI1/KNR4 family protein [Bacillus safensis]|uniref:SMI1/KNR4 family protein n=1 Tax=Bacillus safensis TaxID=561879 RepID=UPI001BA5E095|nr:SMI1/KNR4 family protein [Bacillus safensis]MBR0606359.1 SMI1/KNR4 family protein [Bacillus safensis]WJE40828.1 SMI1/KNR4 family protein [Bacillus safensis]